MSSNPGASSSYGGIMQPVELRAVPVVWITDAFVRPDRRSECAFVRRKRKTQIASGKVQMPENVSGVEASAGIRLKPQRREETPMRASPLARRLAAELGVDLAQVAALGPGGRSVEDGTYVAPLLLLSPTPLLPRPPCPERRGTGGAFWSAWRS